MTELKTLKDLLKPNFEGVGIAYDFELRQEAIKHIKSKPDDIYFRECRIRDWIKDFFNIKDDEID